MTRLLAVSALVVLVLPVVAIAAPVPSQDGKAAVKMYFLNLEKGTGDSGPVLAAPAKEVIPELGAYLTTGTKVQQERAVSMIALVGRLSKDKDVRALAVETLLAHATTEKPAARQALEGLLHFSKGDFPPKAAEAIEKLVRGRDPDTEALLLAGIVEVRSVVKELKALAAMKPRPDEYQFLNPSWSAHLALARLGEADSVKHCIETIAAEKNLAQKVRYFPGLVFIRQKAAAKALAEHLMSEERLPGVKPDDPGTPVAHYALDLLTQNVEGFPVKYGGGARYTDAQLAAARKWVKEQKELKFKP